ncbi:MAG: hypothetical protein HY698_07525 [Deltaproteobacteria bacterium]|nr:hypothetical protein [Deltaproteobacteria bacterium]
MISKHGLREKLKQVSLDAAVFELQVLLGEVSFGELAAAILEIGEQAGEWLARSLLEIAPHEWEHFLADAFLSESGATELRERAGRYLRECSSGPVTISRVQSAIREERLACPLLREAIYVLDAMVLAKEVQENEELRSLVMKVLQSNQEEVLLAVINLLDSLGSEWALDRLFDLTNRGTLELRTTAIHRLGQFDHESAKRYLQDISRNGEPTMRQMALEILQSSSSDR